MSRPWERLSSHKISLLATATTRSTRELSTWQALIVGWIRGRLLRTVRTGDTAEPKKRCSLDAVGPNLSAGMVCLTQKICLTPLDLSESFSHVWHICLKSENAGERWSDHINPKNTRSGQKHVGNKKEKLKPGLFWSRFFSALVPTTHLNG